MAITFGDPCADVLTQNVTMLSLNRTEQLAWLRMITEDDWNNNQSEVETGASYLGIGASADYKSFDEARNSFLKQQQYTLDSTESMDLYTSGVRPDQVIAWLKCKLKLAGGAAAAVQYYDSKNVQGHFVFQAPDGVAPPFKIEVTCPNGKPVTPIPDLWNNSGEREWQYTWTDPSQPFFLNINVGSGIQGLGIVLRPYTPPHPNTIVPTTPSCPYITYLDPTNPNSQNIVGLPSTTVSYLALVGKWTAAFNSAPAWLDATNDVLIELYDEPGNQLPLPPHNSQYMQIPANKTVKIINQDAAKGWGADNATYGPDPWRAILYVGTPPAP